MRHFIYSPGGIIDLSGVTQPSNSNPTLSTSTSTLTNFTNTSGVASVSQNFTLSGTNLTASAVVSAPTGFEVSLNNSSFSSTVTAVQSGGTLTGQPVTIYVRVAAATPAGSPTGNVVITSTGASTRNVGVTATVSSGTATLSTTVGTLSGFSTTTSLPSASQNYTVNGSALSANVIVTPPTNYEVSVDNLSFLSSLTLTPSGGSITQIVYVRVKTGSPSGSVSGNVTNASTGVTTQNVALSGTVSSSLPNAAWNCTLTAQAATGFNNIFGDPNSSLSKADVGTGWVLTTINGTWDKFAGSVVASNTNGGSTIGGSYLPGFPIDAVAGNFVNILKFVPNAYGFQLSAPGGLAAGTYQIDIIGSIKSGVIASGVIPFHAQYGSGTDLIRTLNVQDNTQNIITYTGTITAGQVIKFGVFQPDSGSPAFGVLNAVRITKTN